MPTASVRRRISRLSHSAGLLDQIWVHVLGELGEGEDVRAGSVEVFVDLGQFALDVVQEPVELGVHGRLVGLVVDRVQHRHDCRPHRLRRPARQVRRVVGAAPLPAGAGQVRCDRLDQALVDGGSDQPDSGQAAGDEVGEELVPPRTGFGCGHAHAEDLPVPVAVDAGGEQDDGVDHAAAFADLLGQGVGGDKGERAGGVEGAGAELLDVLVSRSASIRDTWDFNSESMPSVLTSCPSAGC